MEVGKLFRVMYATDREYAYICATSIVSLLENNKNVDDIHIYIFSENLTELDKVRFQKLIDEYGRKLEIIETENIINRFADCDLPKSRGGGYSAYIRLYAPEVLLGIDKIIYMDCDTIVLAGLQALYDIKLEGYVYAAACDWGSARANLPLGKQLTELYFNSGVLVINMDNYRDMKMYEKAIADLNKYNIYKTATKTDQDMINYSFGDKIKKISIKYNLPVDCRLFRPRWLHYMSEKDEKTYYSEADIYEALIEPVVMHFCLSQIIRPWYTNSNDEETSKWIHYYRMTPWCDQERKTYYVNVKRRIIMLAVKYCPQPVYAYLKREKERNRFKKLTF